MARSWFDTGKACAFATRVQEASKHVQPAAQAAAEKHIAAPLRAKVAAEPGFEQLAPHVKVITSDSGIGVGAPGRAGDALNDLEIGTEERDPKAHGLFTAMDHKKDCNREYWKELMRRAK